jgi:hypothetical protein
LDELRLDNRRGVELKLVDLDPEPDDCPEALPDAEGTTKRASTLLLVDPERDDESDACRCSPDDEVSGGSDKWSCCAGPRDAIVQADQSRSMGRRDLGCLRRSVRLYV